MRKNVQCLRVLLAATALLLLLPQLPAAAHQQFNGSLRGPQLWPCSVAGHCVYGKVEQQHQFHKISTYATNCSNLKTTWHLQRQEYYKAPPGGGPGTYCTWEGYYESAKVVTFSRHYTWDIWYWCNNGFNVNVVIYIDSEQYSWDGTYRGGFVRAATHHCHCP